MSFSEETLMAYADGEVDEATRRAVEQAIRHDPAIAARVRRHQTLRADVFGAFAPTMDEAVPQRLRAALRSPKVVHLDTVRAARQPPPPEPVKRRWSWPEWGAIAATLVLGLGSGALAMRAAQPEPELVMENGALQAYGNLSASLTRQLASAAPRQANVRVGLSFMSKEGVYCRTFMLPRQSGLACRSGDGWTVPVLAEGGSEPGAYRQANSGLPGAVLDAIDLRIAGQALDINAEQAARDKGWRK